MNSQVPKLGVIAIDIEKTGCRDENLDPMFAVGIATAPIDASSIEEVESFSISLNLKKPNGKSWSEHWKSEGYELRCWDEFWSKNEGVLDLLQDPLCILRVESREQLVTCINSILSLYESMYSQTIIVTDTTLFDTVCVSAELKKYNFVPLNFTRKGEYRSGVEVDSYISGLFKISDPSDWEGLCSANKFIEPYLLEKVEHDHHPMNDAKSILLKYLAAIKYAKA
jgi:hypothetical protein